MVMTRNVIENEFDKVAMHYEKNRLSEWYKNQAKLVVKELIGEDIDLFLDVGCGTGWLLREAAAKMLINRGAGIDISQSMISQASKKALECNFGNLSFLKADWEKIEEGDMNKLLSNKKADVVVCVSSFHYF